MSLFQPEVPFMPLNPDCITCPNASNALAGGPASIQHPVHRVFVPLIKLNF